MSDSTERGCTRALVVGLGNPGAEYARHRHNVGFGVVDALAKAFGLSFARDKDARAHVATGRIGAARVVLAKPQTYMNLSGRAVGRLLRTYGLTLDCLLVVYDDLDLPLGRIRFRPGGGSGGHKGMRSIQEAVGTQLFPRLRVGIDRPPGGIDPADYVLRPFDAADRPLLDAVIDRAVAAVECWLAEGATAAMDRFNQPIVEESDRA